MLNHSQTEKSNIALRNDIIEAGAIKIDVLESLANGVPFFVIQEKIELLKQMKKQLQQ